MPETFAFLSFLFCAFLNLIIIILIKDNKKKLTLCQRNEQNFLDFNVTNVGNTPINRDLIKIMSDRIKTSSIAHAEDMGTSPFGSMAQMCFTSRADCDIAKNRFLLMSSKLGYTRSVGQVSAHVAGGACTFRYW